MSPLLLALALSVSTSKLGVVVTGDTGLPTSPAAQILAACPGLAVFPISPDGSNVALVGTQLTAFRTVCPASKTIVQVGGAGIRVDATTAASSWYSTWQLQVSSLNRSLITAVEGPIAPIGMVSASDVADFWAQFALNVSGSGFVPVVGALPPGLPFGAPGPNDAFCATTNAVRTAGVSNFAWSVHVSSGTTAMTDQAFAFQQITTDCNLASVPLFITATLPATASWTQSEMTWLTWFDGQLASSNVVGFAAAALGANSGALDLSSISTQFVAQLTNPGGGGGSGGGGGTNSSGGVLPPQQGGTTGELSGSKGGCSTAGADFLALLALPALLARRFARRRPSTPRLRRFAQGERS